MKISLEIDSTESFSTQQNMIHLIEMVIEECEGKTGDGQTSYTGFGGRKQSCKYTFTRTD